ncbi:MAG TPA: DUF4442 domain-containing protein [Dermatophilaceae bacterium]|nr:DUF4442 domain-containing protein [Dermatophilaceae bacterium]
MSQRVGRIKALLSTPAGLRWGMSLWPPYLFAGVRVLEIAPDWRRARVRLARSPLTSNYFGTQFGGSLYSMVDPFFCIMLLRNLGPDHVVWDQRGEIEYVAPGRTEVTAELMLTEAEIEEARAAAVSGEKVLRWFECDILDASGAVVARVRRQLYIRRKRA